MLELYKYLNIFRVLSGFVDVILARVNDHADLITLTKNASVPVVKYVKLMKLLYPLLDMRL